MSDEIHFLSDGQDDAEAVLVLAHGAGAAMDTPFMTSIAEGISARGIRVLRFEFPYMAKRRDDGKRRPPDRQPVLLDTWRSAINSVTSPRVFIGGKSMGGRMASLVADEAGVTGLICLGYPFHPPGKPDRLRVEHLSGLKTPALLLQGERDPFGTREEVPGYPLSDKIQITWLPDGNHDLSPRKKSGYTTEENLAQAVSAALRFIDSV